ncbi:GINS complex subunit Sld [Trema orientale]|uniref:DNA replication complex GINS protein SLD5 n=1 Tax=Trema orientale TaxID=63057 RepID=A0A2P5F5U7_TREOI|nr:GINS complex subunit Sld [Trema orientale]
MVAEFVEASRHWCKREWIAEYSRGVSDIARIGAALLWGLGVEGDLGTLVIPDIGLMIYLKGVNRIVKLELSGCEESYDGIKAIGQCCQMLEELALCDRRMDDGWLAALSYCGNLRTFKALFVSANLRISKHCRYLLEGEADIFEGCSLVTTGGLESVVLSWKELQGLRVISCNNVKDSEEETVDEFAESGVDPLTVSLYQMDLDRTQFLLRSYLRIRLQKIEKYMFHILNTAELFNRLSKEEKSFAERSSNDLKIHLEESVLSRLPDNYQSIVQQSIISEETDMVPKPQLDVFVVCKTKYYLGHIQLEDIDDGNSDNSRSGAFGRGNQRPLEEPFEMEPNVLYFVRYKPIKKFVEEGRIDLY